MTASTSRDAKTYILLFLLVLFGSVGNTILSKGMKDAGDLDTSHLATIEAGALHVLTSGTVWMGIGFMRCYSWCCHMLVLFLGKWTTVL